MTRINILKDMIRLGMNFIPNNLMAYRLCASHTSWFIHAPPGFSSEPCEIDGLQALWLSHRTECESRVVLYLHGGGYVIGSNRTHLELACRISKAAKARTLMLEYRLAPEHPFPAALHDVVTVYKHLLDRGVKARHIVIAGDSAGGGLTMAALQFIRDLDLPTPAAAVCISPWLDLTCQLSSKSHRLPHDPVISPERIRFFARHYAGEHDPKLPGISPFFGDLHDLPPVLIQVGGDEILLSECKQFHRRARMQGVPLQLQVWPHMFHVWHFASRLLPQGGRAIHEIGGFIRSHTPLGATAAA
ncbi:alpha/beta hydrolase [Hahella aquimaris]|uniref:alpha/beta hydrolase n=1 Tax=Hahella sp. HNIBRBA332 TaxID=3015983 RepID=UPI00273AED2E|nr:alpha/beta hydrolase [Hahella sp. HNIBRBA332]WLQ12658.1 alpha/beta hydrolase [Hahella sp. HNIBRBA332]